VAAEYNGPATRSIRNTGRARPPKYWGAFSSSLTGDLEILYSLELLRELSSVIREVKPRVVLTHPPRDYMEDHTNTSRLAVAAAFTRGMPNFKSVPGRPVADYEVTIYHSMPHGLCDELRQRVMPGLFVNTAPVHAVKREALAAHKASNLAGS
jgi:LmbE family N-acetylglucosaminyl deacetylase